MREHSGSEHTMITVAPRMLAAMLASACVAFWGVVPLWLMSVALLCSGYLAWRQQPLPGLLRLVIVMGCVVVFVAHFGFQFTVEVAASFLFLSVALKVLEMRQTRDVYVLVFVLLYLAAVSFLFAQGIVHTLLTLWVVMLAFATLLSLNSSAKGGAFKRFAKNGRYAVKGVLLALPLVVVLFLFFPRLSPLWNIPIQTQTASSGISDVMRPGEIAELSQSSERAMRITFNNMAVPAPIDRYWRGLSLDRFDGETWSQFSDGVQGRARIERGSLTDTQGAFYEIMMEPTNQRWAFALDQSRSLSSHLVARDMGLYRFRSEVIQPTRYRLAYLGDTQGVDNLPTAVAVAQGNRRNTPTFRDLQLPASGNPRTQAFVSALIADFPEPADFVREVMLMFRELPFFYTLEPPTTGANFADEFLFDSRRGFCSHYAGAMAYILRLANIPARVVLGYQGGEYNEEGQYLLIHQYDAHAWVEARIAPYGWVRLDPTAMVAPQRVTEGLRRALGDEQAFGNDPVARAMRSIGALNWARLRLDELNYQWQKWVVNYNQSNQSDFLMRVFGEFSLFKVMMVLLAAFALSCIMVVLYFGWFAMSRHLQPAEKRYLRCLRLMRLLGYHRQPGETGRAFLKRVRPEMQPAVAAVLTRYTEQLYRDVYLQEQHEAE